MDMVVAMLFPELDWGQVLKTHDHDCQKNPQNKNVMGEVQRLDGSYSNESFFEKVNVKKKTTAFKESRVKNYYAKEPTVYYFLVFQ